MMTNRLTYFEEPRVEFGYSQTAEDSRDGLTLFGPYEATQGEARMGVIGTAKGIAAYQGFASEVNKPIFTTSAGRPFFPGFHSAFGLKWGATPTAKLVLADSEITRLLAVNTINDSDGFRLYKDNHSAKFKYGIMRGLALVVDHQNAYLWTKGFIPRTGTTNHMEVAIPLRISVTRGECDIETVIRDILCLTKLNYNACLYGDGLPVTLRFSDKIGNILTALKDVNWAALPFKYYI